MGAATWILALFNNLKKYNNVVNLKSVKKTKQTHIQKKTTRIIPCIMNINDGQTFVNCPYTVLNLPVLQWQYISSNW